MAEHENITAMEETNNPKPSNLEDKDKGMEIDPSKLVQAIVADRDFISSISAAILTNIAPQLKHMGDREHQCQNCWVFCPNRYNKSRSIF